MHGWLNKMETRVIEIDPQDISQEKVVDAAAYIRRGEVVGLPTETVYGLGANAFDAVAVKRIYEAKGRPSDNPLIVHIADMEVLDEIVSYVPDDAKKLMADFWPGPLTIVLPRSEKVPGIVTAGKDTVGVRMPSHPVFREIAREAGVPIAAPSANLFSRPSPTTAEAVFSDMDGRIPLIISSGPCDTGIESTIISFAGERPMLLRPGGVSLEELEDSIGHIDIHTSVSNPGDKVDTPESPGMKYKHYSPDAEVILVEDIGKLEGFLEEEEKSGNKILLLSLDDIGLTIPEAVRHISFSDAAEMAKSVFACFREADTQGTDKVIVVAVDKDGIGLGLMNRIGKAATTRIR
ncbi:MAG: L-threonylcarbamoyladenylate synthase [Candidatus Woesearchaeota archaeon]